VLPTINRHHCENHDLSKGCSVEVKHIRGGLKANISGDQYDYLVFIYSPSTIENGNHIPTATREIHVYPQSVVEVTSKGKAGG